MLFLLGLLCLAGSMLPEVSSCCLPDWTLLKGTCYKFHDINGSSIGYMTPQDQMVNGEWGAWSAWSPCNLNCGCGVSLRIRYCDDPAPLNCGSTCVGEAMEDKACNQGTCDMEDIETVDGAWSSWQDWSACSNSDGCGEGSQSHNRTCDNPTPAQGGEECPGEASEEQTCNLKACVFVCPSGWTEFNVTTTKYCYYSETTSMTPTDAEDNCQSKDSYLTSVHSEEEHNFLKALMDSAWIGLTDRDVEGTWTWMDGTPTDYTNWASGQPNGGSSHNYAHMYTGYQGKWVDNAPIIKIPSICKKPATV